MGVMRVIFALIAIMLIISSVQAFEIKIDGYKGGKVSVRIIPINNTSYAKNISVESGVIRLDDMPNGSYHIIVTYKGMQFVGSIVIPENESLVVNFTSTDDAGVFRIQDMHYILGYQNGSFVIMEVINLANTAEVYFSSDLVKKIPENARHVVVNETTLAQSGVFYEGIEEGEGKIIIRNLTVPPKGFVWLAYRYFLSTNPEIVIDYPAERVRIISPVEISVSVPSEFSKETQIRNDRGQVFDVYKAEKIKKDTVIRFSAEYKPPEIKTQEPRLKSDTTRVNPYVIAGFVLVIAGVVLFLLSGRRGGGEEEWEIREE